MIWDAVQKKLLMRHSELELDPVYKLMNIEDLPTKLQQRSRKDDGYSINNDSGLIFWKGFQVRGSIRDLKSKIPLTSRPPRSIGYHLYRADVYLFQGFLSSISRGEYGRWTIHPLLRAFMHLCIPCSRVVGRIRRKYPLPDHFHNGSDPRA